MTERVEGIHDLGGRQGFGPVTIDPGEPVFRHDWEKRAFALLLGSLRGRLLSVPAYRHGIERMEPGHYLTSPYYEHTVTGLATVLVERGVVDGATLEALAGGRFPLAGPSPADADTVDAEPEAPRFGRGDCVRVRDLGFPGHTRCPSYVMRRVGTVVRVDSPARVPEVEAHLGRRVKEQVYCVRFAASELWPESTDDGASVHVDLYERYLDPQ